MRRIPSNIARAAVAALLTASLLGWTRGAALAQATDGDAEWSSAGRAQAYRDDLIGPFALLGLAGTSAWDHLRDDPEEWHDDAGGLGRRVASNAGRILVGQSTRHALAIAMGHSTRYRRCECTGFGPRLGHALVETATDRTRDGGRALAIPRFAGAFAGAAAQTLWRPEITIEDAAVTAATGLVYAAAVNMVREVVGW